ncbi:MAG: hypothetical protein NC117_07020 [Pseudoflavonifractor sp.]|nr:hypothetical protein [Pseudoflavonifractor sp.]
MKHLHLILPLAMMPMLSACDDDVPMVNLGIDDTYYVYRMTKLPIESAYTGNAYRWMLHRPDGTSEVVSVDRRYIFLQAEEGTYRMTFEVIDPETPYRHDFTVTVMHEEVEFSPYISRVYEYCPAPGQFVNDMPRYEEGDTYADILRKVEESISGKNDIMISLGAYGGYVTFGFDHTVVNIAGSNDLRIWGNAFYELTQPDKKGGSAEPGIVMVSFDANCNGLPDDPWYELAGSEYTNPLTRHGYSITYRRPDPDQEIVEDDEGMFPDLNYIRWDDCDGNEGYIPRNMFHAQEYYPRWVKDDRISFAGTLLPRNGFDMSGMGTYYVLYSYPWGYVDNHPNDYADLNSFDFGWAVDGNGIPVSLPGVDFIRVYTGLNQCCGWLGETSTELCRAQDLHLNDTPVVPDDPISD